MCSGGNNNIDRKGAIHNYNIYVVMTPNKNKKKE